MINGLLKKLDLMQRLPVEVYSFAPLLQQPADGNGKNKDHNQREAQGGNRQ
jgi:hypothetical protein